MIAAPLTATAAAKTGCHTRPKPDHQVSASATRITGHTTPKRISHSDRYASANMNASSTPNAA